MAVDGGDRKRRPVFPCADDRVLVTTPFKGLLVPPDLLQEMAQRGHVGAGDAKRASKAAKSRLGDKRWACWLCTEINDAARDDDDGGDKCKSCARPRVPAWLRLVSGETLRVGQFVRVRDDKARSWAGLLTQINYREAEIAVHVALEEGGNGVPVLKHVSREQVERGVVSVVWGASESADDNDDVETSAQAEPAGESKTAGAEESKDADEEKAIEPRKSSRQLRKEAALSLCDVLLCGDCGMVSKLSNGIAALDSEQVRQDKRGRLRQLEAEVAELETKARYLLRKWRESKSGYDELTECNALLEAKGHTAMQLRNDLAPLQLWCSQCGWEWKTDV